MKKAYFHLMARLTAWRIYRRVLNDPAIKALGVKRREPQTIRRRWMGGVQWVAPGRTTAIDPSGVGVGVDVWRPMDDHLGFNVQVDGAAWEDIEVAAVDALIAAIHARVMDLLAIAQPTRRMMLATELAAQFKVGYGKVQDAALAKLGALSSNVVLVGRPGALVSLPDEWHALDRVFVRTAEDDVMVVALESLVAAIGKPHVETSLIKQPGRRATLRRFQVQVPVSLAVIHPELIARIDTPTEYRTSNTIAAASAE